MIAVSFVIVSLILWNTYVFFQNFKAEERLKMSIWAKAQKELITNTDLNDDIGELSIEILQSNKTTPMIIANQDGSYDSNNIDEEKAKDSVYIIGLINQFKKEYQPIEVVYNNELLSTIYYGNSSLLNKLKYYPLALLLIIILFSALTCSIDERMFSTEAIKMQLKINCGLVWPRKQLIK